MLYTFKYDALGRRVETIQYVDEALGTRWDDGATPTPAPAPRRIRHVYAGLETIQEYACCTGADACGETAPPCECGVTATGCGDGWPLAREIVWGDAARFPEPIVMVDFTGAGMPNTWDPNVPPPTPPIFYYYLHDALGSVVALTDNVGRLVERYTYDPYGRVVVEQPDDQDGPADANPCTTGCDPVEWVANICGDDGGGGGDEVLTANSLTYSAYGNPFMWTGQRYDAVTGTYHFHYRTYSPGLGRWLQRDPAGYVDGINLYAYVLGNPILGIDPLGLQTCSSQPTSAPHDPIEIDHTDPCHRGCWAAHTGSRNMYDKAGPHGGQSLVSWNDVPTPVKQGCLDDCILRCNNRSDDIRKRDTFSSQEGSNAASFTRGFGTYQACIDTRHLAPKRQEERERWLKVVRGQPAPDQSKYNDCMVDCMLVPAGKRAVSAAVKQAMKQMGARFFVRMVIPGGWLGFAYDYVKCKQKCEKQVYGRDWP